MYEVKPRLGVCLTGSFCTFQRVFKELVLLRNNYTLIPIMSTSAATLDTRFGTARDIREQFSNICGAQVIDTIVQAEPIGPKGLLDVLLIAPCTGNTLAKMANGITDTPVTMAAKSHLRNLKPVVIAVSTNDGLSTASRNIGQLINQKNIYLVPLVQDDPEEKPNSLVADFSKLGTTIEYALKGEQLRPVYSS